MINHFPGESRQYRSSDTIVDGNYRQYPQDILNKLNSLGLPMHRISLKKYCPIMFLRNFDPANGHCNGTRYTITQLNSHVIEAVIAIGPHSGKHLFIPQIPLVPSDNHFPFQLRCRQFPIKQAFSFTGNKSQGQTLDRVGVFLRTPMFTLGQLYVAMSRVTDSANLKISVDQTQNIVYKEVL
ncbi:uncharacterized protein LOC115218583 [Octopus sinensis]|uniref:Uncharacterized protein LOC115218583 n=1 Tax=Octopus sinensis TaxID=2607531 RepID=A0A6P7T1V3_9MOLL|nr:uncharacterized protein LOC115218583 [Octopus sinensis]